jgi:ubiquinone/menaquinone biosynthesis C-methylase UbiE
MLLFNYETLVDSLLRDIRVFTPEFCNMKPGDRVLDVCCGTGAQAIEYGRQGISAVGIDIDPDMLRVARRNRVSQNLRNVSFYLSDATALPFQDNVFDSVSISLALHDKTRSIRYKVVSEMIRVARPDGTLIFIDYPVPPVSRRWSCFTRGIEFIAGGEHYEGFKDFMAAGGLEDVMKAFGLKKDKIAYLKGGLLTFVKAKVPDSSSRFESRTFDNRYIHS